MKDVIIYVIGSIVTFCAIYPAYFAYFQREFPEIADENYAFDRLDAFLFSGFLAIFWPIGLPAWCLGVCMVFVVTKSFIYKHGLKWR